MNLTPDWLVSLMDVAILVSAAALSYFLTFLFIGLAYRLDCLDYPVGRKQHKRPTPFLGGCSIFISFWSVIAAGILGAFFFYKEIRQSQLVYDLLRSVVSVAPRLLSIFFGSLIILVVGLFDDKERWTPVKKLTGQFIAAFILLKMGLTINLLEQLGPLGYLATFLWILMLMNAFNFIDSLDGHCTGIALISVITFFWITQVIDQGMVGLFLIAFAGALVGFFPHNFKPAKIFLGDNGSLFIGYMLAAFTLLCRYQTPHTTYATLFIPVLVFGVPIYDTMSVIIVRLVRRTPPWEGDRNHFAHRLVKMGMSDRVAVIFSYFIAVTIGLVAILTTQVTLFGAVLIGLTFLSIIGVIAFLEYYAAKRTAVAEKLAKKYKRRREDIREIL